MRIDSILLSWFRGAGVKAEIKAAGKSCVVYGDNGSGKSSFVDGFEYIMKKSKIDHLSCEYADRSGQRNCVRNTAASDDVKSHATITFVGGNKVSAIVPSDGRIIYESTPDELTAEFQSWKRESHILRQDEVAKFIEQTKSQKYKSLRELLGLQQHEDVYSNFEGLERQLLEKSNLSGLKDRRGWIKEELDKNVKLYSKGEVEKALKAKTDHYKLEYKSIKESSDEAAKNVSKMMEEIEPGILRHNTLKKIHDSKLTEWTEKYLNISKKAQEQMSELINYRLRLLEQAQNYLKSDEEDEIEACPICGAPIDKNKLAKHIDEELEVLKEFKETSDLIRSHKTQITRHFDELKGLAEDEKIKEWLEKEQAIKEILTEIVSLRLPSYDSKWNDETIEGLMKKKQEIDELLKPHVKEDPPSTRELRADFDFFNSAYRVLEYEIILGHISKIEGLQTVLKKIQSNIRAKINEITEDTLERITGDIQALWTIIHPDDPIEDIKLVKSEADKAIDINLIFYGTEQDSPILHLSEGYKNSLGLCVFLALAKQEPIDHPLILDDIVSSLDRDHRAFIVDVLKTELADRQILLFTHDAEWFRELNRRLDPKDWKFFSLQSWDTPERGIVVVQSRLSFDEVRDYLPEDPKAAGTAIRTLMDHELSRISNILEVPMPYLDGHRNEQRGPVLHLEAILVHANERYKVKSGKNWDIYTDPHATWEEAHQLLVEWANRSSHKGTLTIKEAERMIDCCQETLGYFKCPDCRKPIWYLSKGTDHKRCDCGNFRWNI